MQQHTRVLLLVAAGVFMSTLDSSMLNVALPSIMAAYGSQLALTEWVILIYLLTNTVMLLFWGQLSKKYHQATIFTSGTLVFAVGSLLCFLSPGIHLLIFFRLIQGVGASMMMAMGPAIIKSAFPPVRLGSALGQVGIATSIGLMAGPPISGLLIRWSHWRVIFLLTVPVGFLVFFLGRRILKNLLPDPHAGNVPPAGPPFDTIGALLWGAAITLTLLLTNHAAALCCAKQPATLLLAATLTATAAAWVMLIVREMRTAHPLLPLALFRQRFFSMAMLTAMLSFCVLFFVLLLTPFFLRSVQQLSADRTGYVMMALPLCVFFVSPLAGKLHDRIGARIVATTGLGICFAALLLLTCIKITTSPWIIAAQLALLGFGQAMFLSPNSAAALSGVDHDQAGVTSSLLATARNMGMLVGTALAGLIFSFYFSRLTGGMDMKDFEPLYTPEFMQAMHKTFRAAAVLAALGMTASWWRGSDRAGR
jgi:EmrB/QacA subfamily drug resistance transporter